MKRRTTIISVITVVFAAIVVAGLVLTLGRGEEGTRPQGKIAIGYFSKAIGYAPYYVARHHDWFEQHPALADYRIKHIEFNDRATISQAFTSGDLQFLMSADIPAIMCRAQGNDVRVVTVAGVVTFHWLVPSNSPAKSIADLIGKKVAFLPGTSSHYGFLTVLKHSDLSTGALDVLHMTPTEAKAAFETGQLDAWIVWSPFLEQQLVNGKGRKLAGTDYRVSGIGVAASSFIESDPKQVEALVEVMARAKKWIGEHPQQASDIVAEATEQDRKVAQKALNSIDFSASMTDEVIAMWDEMAKFLAEQGKTRLDRAVDVREEFIDTGFSDVQEITGEER